MERLAEPTVVVLGGGVLTSGDPLLESLLRNELAASAPHAFIRVTEAPPIVGAALLGLDEVGVTREVEDRVRTGWSESTALG
jgi:hypothetical protein